MDFDAMVDNYLKRESWPKQEGRYYPSEIGSCMRKIWYSYKHPKKVGTELLKIFHVGNIMHDFIVDVLQSEKNPHVELLEAEFPVKITRPDFVISGRIDDIILIRANGKKILVEVKSHKDVRFLKEPNKTHVMQLQFYMYASGIKDGLLLYINKTDLKTKTFEIVYDENASQEILKRFEKLHQLLLNNQLPEPESKQNPKTAWMCNNCDYKDLCEKNEK